ncbi:MAG: hypothetical protein SFW35_00540 [Chitinophagales bacterium]|nr:hypothetical protein [Chitinophagales bacterium]
MELVCFTVLVAFIVSTTVLICWKTDYIYKISKHPFPKFTGAFALVLLAIIAFIFGIHADIYSSYDRLNNNLSKSYNWFNPADIVRFPVEQYLINQRKFPENQINLDSCFSNNYDRKYTIVIDKTPSIEPSAFTEEISAKLKTNLKAELQGSISQNPLNLDSLKIEDLFVLTAMKQLAIDTSSKAMIEVLYYLGDSTFLSPYDVDIIITKQVLCESIKTFLEFFDNKILGSKKGKYTNFNALVKELKKPKWMGVNNRNIFSNLFIISDFEHEEESGATFAELNDNLHSFNNAGDITVKQINLIKVKGKDNKSDKVNTTLNLIRQNFNHLYFFEFNEEKTYFEQNPIQAISSVFSSTTYDTKEQQAYFYYLWDEMLSRYDFMTEVTLIASSTTTPNILIGLRDKVEPNSYDNYSGYMLLNGLKTKIYPFTSTLMPLDNHKPIKINLTTDNTYNTNYSIELSKPGSTFKVSKPIILREVLPATSCIYLVYLYALFFVSITSLIAYYIVCLWCSHEPYYNRKRLSISLAGGLFAILVICEGSGVLKNYCYLFFYGFDKYYKILFFISMSAVTFLHVFYFYFSYKKKVSSLKEIGKKNKINEN